MLLRSPREGVPAVVARPGDLRAVAEALAAGSGPVAVDAERASGYRYGQRAYLVQLRRDGAGTVLIDPIAVRDLSAVQAAIGDAEWILHAASQDLPCLAEIGLRPETVFDTELAGRLLGRPRVGLAALVEAELGFTLEKGHAAADWSTRPLPDPWVRYAALDVELLIELRAVLAADLDAAGKSEWARQEFRWLVDAPPAPPRAEPWRRTSGINRVRRRRQLAVVRALWQARDATARRADVSPGRILPDAAIVAAASAMPTTPAELLAVPGYDGRGQRRRSDVWWSAVASALALPEAELPAAAPAADGPPPARAWRDRDPDAAARLAVARAALSARADELSVPVENLISPDVVRRVLWQPPEAATGEALTDACRALGARPWQVDLAVPCLLPALAARAADRDQGPASLGTSVSDSAGESPDTSPGV